MDRERASRWIEASEVPMLVAAAVAVVIYVMDLMRLWDAWGLTMAHDLIALAIDVLFVLDLAAKAAVHRGAYLRSPWFVIDFVCTLPVFASLQLAPSVLEGMRMMRMLRVLRALRMLRVLRTLRILRMISDHGGDTPEQVRWHRALTVSVIVYAVSFVALVAWARTTSAQPNRAELHLVLGALMTLMLMLVVARFQIPALFSRQLRALLNVALPEQVADWMLRNPEDYDNTVRMPATVIFSDIKGFTTTVENLELYELKHHLERALEVVVEAHRAQGLIIDKFIGDAVMSFRGGDIAGGTPEEIAGRVVRAALDGQRALVELDDPWFKEVKTGGASSDSALIGAFGTSSRLSYTVLGDKVNLAARFEGACNHLGVTNLFDDESRQLTRGREDLVWRRVGMVRVQGRVGIATAWEAFDAGDDTAWLAAYHRALESVEARQFDRAMDALGEVLETRPDDGPSAHWLAACQRWVGGVDGTWQPVLETRK